MIRILIMSMVLCAVVCGFASAGGSDKFSYEAYGALLEVMDRTLTVNSFEHEILRKEFISIMTDRSTNNRETRIRQVGS